jgi:hypothetical protein
MTETYDTSSLRSAGAEFSSQSQSLAAALKRLKSSLPNTTDMCGDDDQGHQFAAKFKPAADNLHQFVADMSTGLDTSGQGLVTMASNLDGADAASTVPGR